MSSPLPAARRLAQTALAGAALATLAVLQTSSAHAANTAEVLLQDFIQQGVITNSPSSTAAITGIIYSLGTPEDNLATWESSTGGGTASDFLSDPTYFQTISFTGLSVAPGGSFSFSGLDIDLIQTLIPLSVTGSPLGGPETLRNAFVSVSFDSGESGTTPLQQQDWDVEQRLTVNAEPSGDPVPGPLPLLSGPALFACSRRLRRRLKESAG